MPSTIEQDQDFLAATGGIADDPDFRAATAGIEADPDFRAATGGIQDDPDFLAATGAGGMASDPEFSSIVGVSPTSSPAKKVATSTPALKGGQSKAPAKQSSSKVLAGKLGPYIAAAPAGVYNAAKSNVQSIVETPLVQGGVTAFKAIGKFVGDKVGGMAGLTVGSGKQAVKDISSILQGKKLDPLKDRLGNIAKSTVTGKTIGGNLGEGAGFYATLGPLAPVKFVADVAKSDVETYKEAQSRAQASGDTSWQSVLYHIDEVGKEQARALGIPENIAGKTGVGVSLIAANNLLAAEGAKSFSKATVRETTGNAAAAKAKAQLKALSEAPKAAPKPVTAKTVESIVSDERGSYAPALPKDGKITPQIASHAAQDAALKLSYQYGQTPNVVGAAAKAITDRISANPPATLDALMSQVKAGLSEAAGMSAAPKAPPSVVARLGEMFKREIDPSKPLLDQARGAPIMQAPKVGDAVTRATIKSDQARVDAILQKYKDTGLQSMAEGDAAQLATLTNRLRRLSPSQSFDPEAYVREMTAKREAARLAESPGLVGKIGSFFREVKAKLVDSNAPIEDLLARYQRESGAKILPKYDMTNQIDRVLRSPTIAGQFIRDNGLDTVIRKVDNLENIEQYLVARQALAVEKNGIKTGRDLAKDRQLVDSWKDRYGSDAAVVNRYSRQLLDYLVDSDLISKESASFYKERYPEYIPIKRVFSEMEQAPGRPSAGGVASLSRQTVVQKLVGSEREIESPLASLIQMTNDAFKQGEKNKAAKMLASYRDLPGNPFEIKPLRTAENVKARIDIFSEIGELRPIKNSLERLITTRNRWSREIQSELNKLNKQGINEYLKRKTVEPEQKTATLYTIPIPEFRGESNILKPIEMTAKETRDLVNQLVNEPPEKVRAIKDKIATRDKRLADVLDTLIDLNGDLAVVKARRASLFDEAKLLADAESRGKSTFSDLRDGIKEIYEVSPEVAAAAKSMNVQQLNILGKIFAAPVRIAKLGITGINLPFVAANVARDQVTAAINSSFPLRTSIANPAVFTKSLFEAVGHGKVYDEMARNGALGTSFDIARNPAPVTLESIRAGRSPASRIAYTVRHPGELLRAVENLVARSEELTRIQQYTGTKEALLREGRTPLDAEIGASRAARESTVNFARRGEWGQVLNSAFLYLNAGIQGSRTFLRNVSQRPLQTAAKVALVGFTPVAVATAWNMSDPERKAAYDDIAEFEKENNLIIVPPNPTKNEDGTWNIIKIPLSQEIRGLLGMARRPIEAAYGLDPMSVSDIARAFVETVQPISSNPREALSQLTPQAVRPTIEGVANYNLFYGTPQVPQRLQGLSPELQAQPYTSGSARKIGGALGLSPIKVEQWIKGTLGGVGSQFLNASDRVLAGLHIIPPDQIGGQDVLKAIVARFSLARGGHLDDAANEKLQAIIQRQADERFRQKQEAEIIYADLSKLPVDEANRKVSELAASDPAAYEALKSVAESQQLGLDYNDRLTLQLGVTNGERAKFIWENTKAFATADEKNAYLADLRRKKILTEQVEAQLAELRRINY